MGLSGAMGWYAERHGRLVGESVVKTDGSGGGRDIFVLLPERALGGEVLGWRKALRGDRPLCRDVGGLRITPPLEKVFEYEFLL